MPSTRPTVLVRLSASQHQLLSELARLQGRSRASYLNELLDGAEPLLSALLGHMRTHLATIEGQPVTVRDTVAKILTGTYGDEGHDLLTAIERIADQDAATAPPAERSARSGARTHRTAASRRRA